MKKQFKINFKCIFILLIVFIVLFHNNTVFAEVDVRDIKFKLTYYGRFATKGNSLGAGLTYKDFTVNEKYGWYEYEYNGTKCVVLAAATNELLKTRTKYDYIYYFNYYDVIQFKFEDESFDDNTYYGIILDSCDASMNVSGEVPKDGPQILDVYINEDYSQYDKINQKIVFVTDDGEFSSEAGKKKSSTAEFFLNLFTSLFSGLGDTIQELLEEGDYGLADKDVTGLTYSFDDIKNNEELNEKIQVDSFDAEIETNTSATINVSSQIENKYGNKETIYTKDTEIPVISVDMYGAAMNKIELFDVDFFNPSSKNNDEVWWIIRNAVSGFSHAVMYISIGLMLTMLIWRSILYMRSTFGDNPAGAQESMDIINGVIRSAFLISFIYVIAAFLMYGYNEILNVVIKGKDNSYVVRVVVDEVYSFNASIMGYIKYLTLTSNQTAALWYALAYAVIEIFNLFWFGLMYIRMFFIGLLIIISPIVAVVSMRRNGLREGAFIENIFQFRNWLFTYLALLWIPFIAIVIQELILFMI